MKIVDVPADQVSFRNLYIQRQSHHHHKQSNLPTNKGEDMNISLNDSSSLSEMELPPLGGAVFIFFSKNRQQVKMLKWDGDGFLLYQKRLERGT